MTHINFLELIFKNRTLDYLEGKLRFDEMGIDLEFQSNEQSDYTYDRKVSNFTLVLTFLGIIHIYNSLLLIKEIMLGVVNPKSVNFIIQKFSFNFFSFRLYS